MEVDPSKKVEESVEGENNNILRGLISHQTRYHLETYVNYNHEHGVICSNHVDAARPVP